MKLDERGVTLVEIAIVGALATVVMVTALNLSLSMSRAGLDAQRSESTQLDLNHAARYVTQELRQATLVTQPPIARSSPTLEGCGNAVIVPGTGAPTAIDASQPMHWFAFCSGAGQVFYHEGNGCPAAYFCGAAPQLTFGAGLGEPATALFTRSASGTTVDVALSVKSRDGASSLQTGVTVAGAQQ